MSVGIYGTKKLADITAEDADVLYAYSPSREELGDVTFKPLYNSISESEYSGYLLCDDKKQTVETVTSINSIITFLELSKNDILNCLEYLLKLVEKGEILYDTLDKCDISVGMLTGRLRKIKYITMQFEQYLK